VKNTGRGGENQIRLAGGDAPEGKKQRNPARNGGKPEKSVKKSGKTDKPKDITTALRGNLFTGFGPKKDK